MKKISLLLAIVLSLSCLYAPVSFAEEQYVTEEKGFSSAEDLFPSEIYAIKDTVINGIKNCDSKIDISSYKITPEKYQLISELISYYAKTDPEMFNFKSAKITYKGDESTGYIKTIDFDDGDHYYSLTEYKTMLDDIDTAVDKFIKDYNLRDKELTDLQKALLVHDKLIENTEYDYERYMQGDEFIPAESYSPYGALVKHICVCEGYSRAYLWILRELGIDCYLCSSAACGHMWNVVKIDGEYYYVDLTDDDPPDIFGRVYHKNFLLSEKDLRETDKNHRPEDPKNVGKDGKIQKFDYLSDCPGKIASESKDGVWKNSETGFQYVAGDIYYIDNTTGEKDNIAHLRSLTNTDFNKINYSIEGIWHIDGDPNYQYRDNFSRLVSDENHLFFNTANKLWSLNLTDGLGKIVPLRDKGAIALPENHEIYGLKIEDGKFVYQTATNADIFPGDERNIITEEEKYSDIMFMCFDVNDLVIKYKKEHGDVDLQFYVDPFKSGAYDPASDKPLDDSIKVTVKNENILTVSVKIDDNGLPYVRITPKSMGSTSIVINYNNESNKDIENHTSVNSEIPIIVDNYKLETGSKSITTQEIEDLRYKAEAHNPDPWIEYHGHLLEKDKDYTISYENNINAGTAYVVFTGKGEYSGKAKIPFIIKPVTLIMDLKKLMLNAEYTGKPAKVKFTTVSFGDDILKEGKDYTISYKNNINVGTAHITLTGKGNFCGSVSASFDILPTVPKSVTLSQKTYTYDGKAKKPTVKAYNKSGKVIPSSQYTVKYASGRKAVGRYKVTVTFKNNYGGKAVMYFKIKPSKPKITTIISRKKGLKIYWGKKSGITGYHIQISTSKKFKNCMETTINKSKTGVSVSGLKAKKKYYIRLRTYKKIGKEYFYSSWSNCTYKKTK